MDEDPRFIYFAHSLRDYGTPKAKRALSQIHRFFPESMVHNPENFASMFRPWGQRIGYTKTYLSFLLWLLRDDGGVVVLEHKGSIGRGVYEEVVHTIDVLGFPVWVLRRGRLERVTNVQIKNRNDWAVHYGQLITNTQTQLGDSTWAAGVGS